MSFHRYVQWIAFSQWQAVRAHCEEIGVSLMGDVPVGVSIYSCDVWSEPQVFDLTRSSGAPPEKVFKADPFTEKWGQNWGFPLYDWFAMSKDNFAWWRRRLRAMTGMFDLVRVDHALGFFRIYSFPVAPEQNAEFLNLTEEQAKERTGGRLPGFEPRDDSTPENRERNRAHGEVIFKIMLDEIPRRGSSRRISAPCLTMCARRSSAARARLQDPAVGAPLRRRAESHAGFRISSVFPGHLRDARSPARADVLERLGRPGKGRQCPRSRRNAHVDRLLRRKSSMRPARSTRKSMPSRCAGLMACNSWLAFR